MTFPDYTVIPGSTTTLGQEKTELYFFDLLFPLNLCAWIANKTNRYATQQQAEKENDRPWEETTSREIRTFLGMRLVMSVIDLPDMKMFW